MFAGMRGIRTANLESMSDLGIEAAEPTAAVLPHSRGPVNVGQGVCVADAASTGVDRWARHRCVSGCVARASGAWCEQIQLRWPGRARLLTIYP